MPPGVASDDGPEAGTDPEHEIAPRPRATRSERPRRRQEAVDTESIRWISTIVAGYPVDVGRRVGPSVSILTDPAVRRVGRALVIADRRRGERGDDERGDDELGMASIASSSGHAQRDGHDSDDPTCCRLPPTASLRHDRGRAGSRARPNAAPAQGRARRFPECRTATDAGQEPDAASPRRRRSGRRRAGAAHRGRGRASTSSRCGRASEGEPASRRRAGRAVAELF